MADELWKGVREGCGTCEFWIECGSNDIPTGQCRRHPPVMLVISCVDPWGKPASSVEQHQPWTQQDAWCGEYRRKGAA